MNLVREEERMMAATNGEFGKRNSSSGSGNERDRLAGGNGNGDFGPSGKKKKHNVIGWNYEMILACAIQAGRGMTYLHSNNPPICHRDLKSSNLVVDEHWVVKVTDFGTSRMLPGGIGDVKLLNSSQSENNNKAAEHTMSSSSSGSGSGGSGRIDSNGSSGYSSGVSSSISNMLRGGGNGGMSNGTSAARGKVEEAEFGNENPRESAFDTLMTSNVGTTAWVAPEMFTSEARASYR